METKIADTPEVVLVKLSEAMGVAVMFQSAETGPVTPTIDINAIISKLVALMVYVGWSVPANISPPFNRVNADMEYWKKAFAQDDPDKEPAKESEKEPLPEDNPDEPAPEKQDQPADQPKPEAEPEVAPAAEPQPEPAGEPKGG